MSAKTGTAQVAGRRTPLSLNAATKQGNKANNKNDNSKKEANSISNQKTDNSKKDSQSDKKNFAEKKERKLSSDTKKTDEVKTANVTNEDSKKGQNGVSNGVKDKEKTTDGPKSATPKRDSQKTTNSEAAKTKTEKKESLRSAADKKDDSTAPVVVKETKKEETKNKEKVVEESSDNLEEKKKDKERKTKEKEKVINESSENLEEKKDKERKDDAVNEVLDKSITPDAKNTETKTPEKLLKDTRDAPHLRNSGSKKDISLTEQKVEEDKVTDIEESPKAGTKLESEQSDDIEMMEALTYDDELAPEAMAASTPAKFFIRNEANISPKSEAKLSCASAQTPERKSYPRTFSAISGRRSIRPIGDYSFSGNLQIRESYRKINTELDFTTTSLNVTVGSEVPNNDSFSFFSRSRKRDRSSPSLQSTMEVQGDISPKSPKRARIDIGMSGFFSAMASPISMLRSRLARTSVQSTPKKQVETTTPVEEDVVENVSGISVNTEITATEDLTMNPDSTVDNAAIESDQMKSDDPIVSSEKPAAEDVKQEDDPKLQDIVITAVNPQPKKKCSIM